MGRHDVHPYFLAFFFPSEVDLCGAVPLIAVSLLTALWQSCQFVLPRSQAHLQSLSSQLLEFTLHWKHLENLLGGNLAAAGDES